MGIFKLKINKQGVQQIIAELESVEVAQSLEVLQSELAQKDKSLGNIAIALSDVVDALCHHLVKLDNEVDSAKLAKYIDTVLDTGLLDSFDDMVIKFAVEVAVNQFKKYVSF